MATWILRQHSLARIGPGESDMSILSVQVYKRRAGIHLKLPLYKISPLPFRGKSQGMALLCAPCSTSLCGVHG